MLEIAYIFKHSFTIYPTHSAEDFYDVKPWHIAHRCVVRLSRSEMLSAAVSLKYNEATFSNLSVELIALYSIIHDWKCFGYA